MDNQSKAGRPTSLGNWRERLKKNIEGLPGQPVVSGSEDLTQTPGLGGPSAEERPVHPDASGKPTEQEPDSKVQMEPGDTKKDDADVPVTVESDPAGDDPLAGDLKRALDKLLSDRQFRSRMIASHEEELALRRQENESLQKDISRLRVLLEEKDREIGAFQEQLGVQKMTYDQLSEDYRVFTDHSRKQEEQIRLELEKEREKYGQLREEHDTFKSEYMKQYNMLKDVVRDKGLENRQLQEKMDRIQEEKDKLVQSIGEFTKKMDTLPKAPVAKPVTPQKPVIQAVRKTSASGNS